jgi:hypothetical protein
VKRDDNTDNKQIITCWNVRTGTVITEFAEWESHSRRAGLQKGAVMKMTKKEIRKEGKCE